jgi:integrase
MAEGVVGKDAAQPLAGMLKTPVVKRMPAILDLRRAGRLMLVIRSRSGRPIVAAALKMIPHALVRPGELRQAERADIDLENSVWQMPAVRMKTRSPHRAVVNPSREHFAQVEAVDRRGKVFVPRPQFENQADMALNAALRHLGYGRDEICGRGFRSMASTVLNGCGYYSDWIERRLAHVESNGVRAAYNRADWLPERWKMTQDWADLLDELVKAAAKG